MSDPHDADMAELTEFLVSGNNAIEAAKERDAVERRHKAMLLSLALHTDGEGNPLTDDAVEVARTAVTIDRFLRGGGVARGKPEAV